MLCADVMLHLNSTNSKLGLSTRYPCKYLTVALRETIRDTKYVILTPHCSCRLRRWEHVLQYTSRLTGSSALSFRMSASSFPTDTLASEQPLKRQCYQNLPTAAEDKEKAWDRRRQEAPGKFTAMSDTYNLSQFT